MSRMKEFYKNEAAPALHKQFNYKNKLAIPMIEKIVLNMGIGEAVQNAKLLESGSNDLAIISGQKPVITRAKKSIAGFKIRKGMAIGLTVTLRRRRMYDFFDRLVNVALPRVRDFRGVSGKSFDGRGNYSLGIAEQIIFPEIDYDKVDSIRGFSVTIVTTAETDEEAKALLKKMGMPFRN